MTVLWATEYFLPLFSRFHLVCHLPRTSHRFGTFLVGSWVQIASEKVRHQCANKLSRVSTHLMQVVRRQLFPIQTGDDVVYIKQ